jgi:hypothetical protein
VVGPAANAVDVTVKGFTWAAAGTWSLFAVVSTFILGLIRAIGPLEMAKAIWARKSQLRDEAREDGLSLTDRMDALETRASTAERRLNFVASACTTLLSALEAVDPDNPALGQARSQLAMASGKEVATDPFADMLERLAKVPPVIRNPK